MCLLAVVLCLGQIEQHHADIAAVVRINHTSCARQWPATSCVHVPPTSMWCFQASPERGAAHMNEYSM